MCVSCLTAAATQTHSYLQIDESQGSRSFADAEQGNVMSMLSQLRSLLRPWSPAEAQVRAAKALAGSCCMRAAAVCLHQTKYLQHGCHVQHAPEGSEYFPRPTAAATQAQSGCLVSCCMPVLQHSRGASSQSQHRPPQTWLHTFRWPPTVTVQPHSCKVPVSIASWCWLQLLLTGPPSSCRTAGQSHEAGPGSAAQRGAPEP